MSGLNGRKAKLFKGVIGEAVAGPTEDLTDGNIYFVKAVGETSTLPIDEIGAPFIAQGTITLGDGDEVYPLTQTEIGIAKDKSASPSKGVLDSTTDADDRKTYISDGLADQTISFSGNATADSTKTLIDFEKVFSVVVEGDGTGSSYTVSEFDDDPIWLVFDYTVRGRVNDGDVKMRIVPALLTGGSMNAAPEAVQDFSFDGQDAGVDANGCKSALIYDKAVVA